MNYIVYLIRKTSASLSVKDHFVVLALPPGGGSECLGLTPQTKRF